jgi:hypothetical protein
MGREHDTSSVSERCTATTAKGTPCKAKALPGLTVCVAHAGRVGRRSLLSPAVTARVVQIVQAGGYMESAAAAAGISRRALFEWLARGDPAGSNPDDEPYREFRAAVDRAKAEAEARHVVLISSAASKDWKAAAWLLERQNPERWARPTQRPDDVTPRSTPDTDPLDALDAQVVELAPRRARRR